MESREINGQYRLERLISSTGSGRSFRAQDKWSGTTVTANLVSLGEVPQAEVLRQRLETTMGLLRTLEHPNLPSVLDCGFSSEGDAFLILEWIEGQDLESSPDLSAGRVLSYMTQVVDGLECLTLHGLVHLSLTPDKLVLAQGDRVKILGLGTSLYHYGWEPSEGQAERPQATVFAAPELLEVRIDSAALWRADLYSVARQTCRLLGAAVSGAGTLTPDVRIPDAVTSALENPEDLRHLLEACLHREPTRRPVSYSKVARAFQDAMASGGGGQRSAVRSDDEPSIHETQELIGSDDEPSIHETQELVGSEDEESIHDTQSFVRQLPGVPGRAKRQASKPRSEPQPETASEGEALDWDSELAGVSEAEGGGPDPIPENASVSAKGKKVTAAQAASFKTLPSAQQGHGQSGPSERPIGFPSDSQEFGRPGVVLMPGTSERRVERGALRTALAQARRITAETLRVVRSLAGQARWVSDRLPARVRLRWPLLVGIGLASAVLGLLLAVLLREPPPQAPLELSRPAAVEPPVLPLTPSEPEEAEPLHPQLEAALAYLAEEGYFLEARQALAAITPEEEELLSPAACEVYESVKQALRLMRKDQLVADLERAFETSDLGLLRSTFESVTEEETADLEELEEGSALLARARKVASLDSRTRRAMRNGVHAAALEQASLLLQELPRSDDALRIRAQVAANLEAEAEALVARGRPEEAEARLAVLRRVWPERPGLQERLQIIGAHKRSLADALRAAAAAERRQRPHEGLLLLASVVPSGQYEERFKETRERLQEQLARLDRQPPVIELARDSSLAYKKGAPATVKLRVKDDYQVKSLKCFARTASNATPREFSLRSLGGDYYLVEITRSFHRDATIQFWVTASDYSGHTDRFGSRDNPRELRRKKWYRR